MAHGNPKHVFIGGGGEGATAREVLRFKSVEKLTMVDIDPICVEECKKHLPQHHKVSTSLCLFVVLTREQGAFDDKRMNLVVDDAAKVLRESADGSYDVIILDLAGMSRFVFPFSSSDLFFSRIDPLPDGPCWQLYTDEFYSMVRSKLSADGVLVTQSGPGGIQTMTDVMTPVYATLKKVFGDCETYVYHMCSFFDLYSCCVCRNNSKTPALASMEPKAVDERIKAILPTFSDNFHYDGETHSSMFNLSRYHRKAIKEETRLITKDAGAFLYHRK